MNSSAERREKFSHRREAKIRSIIHQKRIFTTRNDWMYLSCLGVLRNLGRMLNFSQKVGLADGDYFKDKFQVTATPGNI